jgi:ankyrin repeat protein
MSSLMHAVFNENEDLVQLLMDTGADPHLLNVYKGSALSIAKLSSRESISRILKKALELRDEEKYLKVVIFLGTKIEQYLNTILFSLGYSPREAGDEL